MFGWFRLHRSRRIRKDAGELTLADWRTHPVWEFCLDEESVPGQTECTMRPSVVKLPISTDVFDGGVAATITLANGRSFPGVVWPKAPAFDGPTSVETEIWLDKAASELCDDPMPRGWDQIIYDTCHRIGFSYAWRSPDDAQSRELIGIVYKVLGVTADEMWPIKVIPLVQLKHWPRSWTLDGWRRSDGEIVR